MNCQYTYNNGSICKNIPLNNSNFCYIKTHHENIDEYNNIVKDIKTQFINNSENNNNFKIIDVLADGSCAYRCMSLALYNIIQNSDLNIYYNNEHVDYLKRFLEQELTMDEYLQKTLSILIQNILREWIYENKNLYIDNLECNLENFVLSCHDVISIDEYYELYKIYSGYDNYIKIDTGKIYKKGKNAGKSIYKKEYIKNRWGASPEHFAFSKIFNIKLSIYVLKKYDEKKCKIVNGSINCSNSRFCLWQTFNHTLDDNAIHIKFLLTNKQNGHYLYLQ